MSSEERQRMLREAGSKPGETQKQTEAEDSKQAEGVEDAQLGAEAGDAPDGPTPVAEDDSGPPRPRR